MKVLSKALLVAMVITFFVVAFIKGCTKEVTYKGVVMSHAITSDRYGDIHYHTIASFDDGIIRRLVGLKYYIIPVGSKVSYTERIYK